MGMVVVGGFMVAGTYYLINNVIIPSLPSSQARCFSCFMGRSSFPSRGPGVDT